MEKIYVYFCLSKNLLLEIASQGLNTINEGDNYPGICPILASISVKKETEAEEYDKEGFKKEFYEEIAQSFLNFDSVTIKANSITARLNYFSLGSVLQDIAIEATAYGKTARGTFYKGKKYFPYDKIWFQVPVPKDKFNEFQYQQLTSVKKPA